MPKTTPTQASRTPSGEPPKPRHRLMPAKVREVRRHGDRAPAPARRT